MNNIGNNITNLRKNHTMSQEQLAEIMHVSRQSVSKWERNEALPDIYNLKALADVFGISVDQLLGEEPIDRSQIGEGGVISTDQLSQEDIFAREEIISQANLIRIVAIIMYILAPFMWMLLEEGLKLNEGLVGALFGSMIAIATGIIIYSGFLSNKAKRLYGPTDEEKQDEKCEDERYPLLSSVIYTCATLIFLYFGFFKGLWHPAWIVFIIANLVLRLITLIAVSVNKNGESDNISENKSSSPP